VTSRDLSACWVLSPVKLISTPPMPIVPLNLVRTARSGSSFSAPPWALMALSMMAEMSLSAARAPPPPSRSRLRTSARARELRIRVSSDEGRRLLARGLRLGRHQPAGVERCDHLLQQLVRLPSRLYDERHHGARCSFCRIAARIAW